MTERQQRFVAEYIVTANATEAAKLAGYSAKTAYSIGERLLKNEEIRRAIDERLKEMESEKIAETQEILEHLTAVIRGLVTEEIVTNSGMKLVAKVSEKERLKACELMLRVRGEFRDKTEVKVDGAQAFMEAVQQVWQRIDDKK